MNIQQKKEYVQQRNGAIPYLNVRYNEADDLVLTFQDGWFVESQRWDDYHAKNERPRRA
ncbi:MAG: hypothetical protein AAF496_11855 [Pseudomonadota bacterium]